MSGPGDLTAALEAVMAAGDPWRARVDYCPGCKGRGWYTVLKAHGDFHDARKTCLECDGTGQGDPPDERDSSDDE